MQDSDYIASAYTVTQDSNQWHDYHTGQPQQPGLAQMLPETDGAKVLPTSDWVGFYLASTHQMAPQSTLSLQWCAKSPTYCSQSHCVDQTETTVELSVKRRLDTLNSLPGRVEMRGKQRHNNMYISLSYPAVQSEVSLVIL